MVNTQRYKTMVLAVMLAMMILGTVFAADLQVPPTTKSGDLFVTTILPDSATDKQVTVRFNALQIQFMGAVQGTPDIQIISDGEIEIKPDNGKLANVYELKFLALMASGSSPIKLQDQSGERSFAVNIFVPEAQRGYSWLILLGGVILLVAGIKVWRYQKSSTAMMSTKSLFMNYEELEKARKMYFPDEDTPAVKGTTPDSPIDTNKTAESAAIPAPKPFTSGGATAEAPAVIPPPLASSKPTENSFTANKTQQSPAINPHSQESNEHLKNRLAALFNDEEEKDTKAEAAEKPDAVRAVDVRPEEKSAVPVLEAVEAVEEMPVVAEIPPPVIEAAPEASGSEPVVEGPLKTRPMQQPAIKITVPASALNSPSVADTPPTAIKNYVRIVFAIEDGSGRRYEATGTAIRIGRKKENQICITASEVSREHAEVSLNNGTVAVRSLTESNTIQVNNRDIKGFAAIKPGDTLNLGGSNYVVQKARPID